MPAKNSEGVHSSHAVPDRASTEVVERQRQFLHLGRSCRLALSQGHAAYSRRAFQRRIQGKIERWHQALKNRILPESACIGDPIKGLSQNKLAMPAMRQPEAPLKR